MIDSTYPTFVPLLPGTVTNVEINLEFADNVELAAEIGNAHVRNDTNIDPSLDANTYNQPLIRFQRIYKPPPYLQSYKCSLVTCANQTQYNSSIVPSKQYPLEHYLDSTKLF